MADRKSDRVCKLCYIVVQRKVRWIMNPKHITSIIVLASLLISSGASAFTFLVGLKSRVEGGEATFHVDIPGVSPSGVRWNDAFRQAADAWSAVSPVTIDIVPQAVTPCEEATSHLPAVGFSSTCYLFDESRSKAAVAYAIPTLAPNSFNIINGQIVYRGSMSWDVYDGLERATTTYDPVTGAPKYNRIGEFGRTTLHEIGHTLGLGHSVFPGSSLSEAGAASRSQVLNSDDICGVAIANDRPDMCPLLLSNPVTVSGKSTSAHFVAGASKDKGKSFTHEFAWFDTVDLMATVVVEDAHYGLPGRLLTIIELSDGTMLMKIGNDFLNWDGSVEALRAAPLVTLSGANEMYILENFNLRHNQVSNVGVAVFVGYSLDSEPNEIYYSGSPLQFHVN